MLRSNRSRKPSDTIGHDMGLEDLEIIMEVEEAFGIKIPDEDCTRILTVGGMAHYVENRLYGTTTPLAETRCATARGLYALRRAMMSTLGVERAAIRPKAKLRTLVPYSTRHQFWVSLEREGLRAPPLRVPDGVQIAVIALAGLVGMLLLWGWLRYGRPVGALFVVWIPIACGIAMYVLRRANAFFPASCATVGDLARQTWLENHDAAAMTPSAVTDSDVLERVKIIIAENLSIPKESLQAETRFADILP
jgi:acyl carrier protein